MHLAEEGYSECAKFVVACRIVVACPTTEATMSSINIRFIKRTYGTCECGKSMTVTVKTAILVSCFWVNTWQKQKASNINVMITLLPQTKRHSKAS